MNNAVTTPYRDAAREIETNEFNVHVTNVAFFVLAMQIRGWRFADAEHIKPPGVSMKLRFER